MLMNEYGSKYQVPSPEIARRLQLSREEAEKVKTREMRCPFCGFLVRIIPENQTDVVFVYCRKCKFDGPLSPAYFRRMKRYRQYALEFQKRRMNR